MTGGTAATTERAFLAKPWQARALHDGKATLILALVDGCVEYPGEYSEEAWYHGKMPQCHVGSVGARLFVQEAWGMHSAGVWYAAGGDLRRWETIEDPQNPARPQEVIDVAAGERTAETMPHWAARTVLEIQSIRCLAADTIPEECAIATGLHVNSKRDGKTYHHDPSTPFAQWWTCPIEALRSMWDSAATAGAKLDDNPWLWALTVRRVEVP